MRCVMSEESCGNTFIKVEIPLIEVQWGLKSAECQKWALLRLKTSKNASDMGSETAVTSLM